MFALHPALAEDSAAIRALVRIGGINPTGLDWRRFVVAVDESGLIIGCGQVKPHPHGARELASIAVLPECRGRGVASSIVQHLVSTHPAPLYLTCRLSLGPFYERFGFRVIHSLEMPPYFRRIASIAKFLKWLGVFHEELLVMVLEA